MQHKKYTVFQEETVVGGQFNMENTSNKKVNVKFMTELALLIAIIVIMALTPIGYIRTPIITLTLITIPVAVGGIIMGPLGGAICGLTFGLTSLYMALTAPSAMMAAFVEVNPFYTAILCIVPRVIDGWLCGLIFKGLRKATKSHPLSYYIAGISCPVFNTVLFMSTLVLLFYNCEFVVNLRSSLNVTNAFAFIIAVVGVQALIEALCCGLVSGFVSQQLNRVLKR